MSATCIWVPHRPAFASRLALPSLLGPGRRAAGRGCGGSRSQLRLPSPRAGLCGWWRVCCVEVRDGPERLLGLPGHAGVGRAAAVAVPRRFRMGGAERTEPAAEALDQAVAGHVEVIER